MSVRIAALMVWMTAFAVPAAASGVPATTEGQNERSAFMRVFGPVAPPSGYIGFCDMHPTECDALVPRRKGRFDLTALRMIELQSINTHVNRLIAPRTDAEQYGRLEHWTYPTASGDCEDYALLKRRILIERGWPASALLLTVVRDEHGEGHALLTVRTRQGDFLLDNRRDDVSRWNALPYEFIKRQSYLNPRIWVALNPTVQLYSRRSAFVLSDH